MEKFLTIWTIRLAIACLFTFLIANQLNANRAGHRSGFRLQAVIRATWLAGAIFALLHMVFAMGFIHDWDHQQALDETRKQTEELLGMGFSAGIYFNYVFVVLWMLDASWLFFFARSHSSRPRWVHCTIQGYLVFIALNGAIVFERGWTRWATISLVLVWLVAWRKQMSKPKKIDSPE